MKGPFGAGKRYDLMECFTRVSVCRKPDSEIAEQPPERANSDRLLIEIEVPFVEVCFLLLASCAGMLAKVNKVNEIVKHLLLIQKLFCSSGVRCILHLKF